MLLDQSRNICDPMQERKQSGVEPLKAHRSPDFQIEVPSPIGLASLLVIELMPGLLIHYGLDH